MVRIGCEWDECYVWMLLVLEMVLRHDPFKMDIFMTGGDLWDKMEKWDDMHDMHDMGFEMVGIDGFVVLGSCEETDLDAVMRSLVSFN